MMQPDELAIARALHRITRGGIIPFEDAIALLCTKNCAPKIVQGSFFAKVSAGIANAQLLIPKNPRRKSLLIANPNSSGIFSSYGRPPIAPTVADNGFGGRINNRDYYLERSATISIDDIWVWGTGGTQFVLGYEGTLAVT